MFETVLDFQLTGLRVSGDVSKIYLVPTHITDIAK